MPCCASGKSRPLLPRNPTPSSLPLGPRAWKRWYWRTPWTFGGGTGGYFKMGQYLQLPATNPTKVLISLANAMGVNVPMFGKDIFKDTSPLAGLTA